MKLNVFRKLLMILLIVPFGMIAYACISPNWQWENSGLELLFLVTGVPIMILNFLAWYRPELFQAFFPGEANLQQGTDKEPAALMSVVGAFMAFVFIGVGIVAAIGRVSARPELQPTTAQLEKKVGFQVFTPVPAMPSDTAETVIGSTQAPLPEIGKVPVSGGVPTNTASLPATAGEGSSALVKPTNTPTSAPGSTSCAPANPEHLEVVQQAVQSADLANDVRTAWAIQSKEVANLYFVAAKIYQPGSDSENNLPGVWGLVRYPDGYFDVFSINDIAKEFSYTAWGEDSDPPLSMESDGAQGAYNCAVKGN